MTLQDEDVVNFAEKNTKMSDSDSQGEQNQKKKVTEKEIFVNNYHCKKVNFYFRLA